MYRDLLTRAQGVASTPYQAYTGELTAPINAQQTAGISGINANAGYASPFIQQASQQASASSAPITAGQIQQYQNPYTQQVIDATTGQMAHDNASQMASLQGNQIAQGALGGNATGVAKGILAGQQGRTMASTVAGLYDQSYKQALGAAQQQQQTGLAGANAQANYGISGQNAALTGATAQVGAGSLQQTAQQVQDAALYQQYAQAQAYPYQQTQWLAGLGTGVGSNLGGTSSGQTTGPAPNMWGQILGLGTAAVGAMSDRDAKDDIERIGKMNDGTPIYRFRYKGSPEWHVGPMAQDVEKRNPDAVSRGVDGYLRVDLHEASEGSVKRASGGGVAPWSAEAGPGWIPTMGISSGAGAPHASAPGLPSTPAFDAKAAGAGISSGIKGLKGMDWAGVMGGGGFSGEGWGGGSFLGGDAYGGSSASPLAGLSAEDYGGGFADGGAVMSDEDSVGVAGGQKYAQQAGSPWSLSQNANGTVSVVNTRTGQVVHTGTHSTASMIQASMSARPRASGGGVAGYAGGGAPFDGRFDASFPARNPTAETQDWLSPEQGGYNFLDQQANPDPFGDTNRVVAHDALQRGDGVRSYGGEPPVVSPDGKIQGNLTSSQGVAPAPVVAEDEEEAPIATGVAGRTRGAGTAPVMAFGPEGTPDAYGNLPDAIRKPGGDERGGFGLLPISPNASTGLITAGLGMMASRSPFLGNQIGEGGLAGMSAYGTAEEKDRAIAAEAAKLARESREKQQRFGLDVRKQDEAERHNAATEGTAKAGLDKTKYMPAGSAITADGSYHPLVLNQATGQVIDAVTNKPPTATDKVQPKDQKGGPISQEDARAVAEYYVKTGDNSRINALGITASARQAVQGQITKVMKENNVTPEEMGTRVAEFAGRKAGQRTLGTMEAKMGAAAFEAEGAIKQARGVIERLPRTSFLPFNQLLQGFSNKTLNPDQTELYGRTQAIVNTYAAVMARGANVTTDSSRHHAEALLNTAGNAETYNRMLDTMLQEINMAKESPAKMREFYSKTYGPKAVMPDAGAPPAAGGAPPATAAIPPPAQREVGKVYPTPKGNLKWTAQGWVQP